MPGAEPTNEGVRKGLLVVAILLPTVVTWLYFLALAQSPAVVQQAAYAIGKGVQFAVLPVIWLLVSRQRPSLMRPTVRGLGFGLAFGGFLLVAMWLLYQSWLKPAGFFDGPAIAVREKVIGMGLASLPVFMAMSVFYALIHSLLEEYYWRWFVFGELCAPMRLSTAIAVSSIAFALHHVLVLADFFGWASPVTYLFAACVAVGGAIWAWLYRASGSLLGPWLSHALVDASIFLIAYDLCRDILR